MESQSFYEYSLSEGNLQMNFRASLLGHDVAIFNIRTIQTGHDTVHDASEYDAARFLASSHSQRYSLVSNMMYDIECLYDDARALYWGDLVALLVQDAVARRAELLQRRRGIRFNIDFYVGSGTVSSLDGDADGYGNDNGNEDSMTLKRMKYDVDGTLKEGDCSICHEEYKSSGKDLTQIPCLHCFHYDCLEEWVKRSRSCPLCRQQID